MKDFLGNTVEVGDYVVCNVPYTRALARVYKLTPFGVTVEYKINGQRSRASRIGHTFAKVDPQDAMISLLAVDHNM